MNKIKMLLLGAGALLVAMPAMAADIQPKPMAVYAPTQAVNWTGFYAGAHIGGAFGSASTTDVNGGVPPGPFNYTTTGVIGGGQVGVNYQWSNIVSGMS